MAEADLEWGRAPPLEPRDSAIDLSFAEGCF